MLFIIITQPYLNSNSGALPYARVQLSLSLSQQQQQQQRYSRTCGYFVYIDMIYTDKMLSRVSRYVCRCCCVPDEMQKFSP